MLRSTFRLETILLFQITLEIAECPLLGVSLVAYHIPSNICGHLDVRRLPVANDNNETGLREVAISGECLLLDPLSN